MKILIMYASKSGTTETCAQLLKSDLPQADLVNLGEEKPDLENYDIVLAGGSIRYGSLNDILKSYVEEHVEELAEKQLGLFICCASQTEQQINQLFIDNFPPALLKHAFAKESFGGEIRNDRLSFIEKVIIKLISKRKDYQEPSIHETAIHEFAHTAEGQSMNI
ncbi:MAG: flavodoxin domain-containing protein [Bacillus sp. (in: firmicutes)]